MKYEEFIRELIILIDQAKEMFNLRKRDSDPQFRAWRHSASDLIQRIKKEGYDVNSAINGRVFDIRMGYWSDPTPKECIAVYNRDLQDTINEFQTIVTRFNAYGEPTRANIDANNTENLRLPEKVTYRWIRDFVPIHLWFSAVGVLVAIFSAGVYIGQTSFYKDITTKSIPESQSTSMSENTSNETIALPASLE
ncbi:MAG: hypothetical protein KZQ92_09475 [Candidatus Thiodiazotropha sp. (ex Lucinoma borealis)]|nr:hypothetical protein [Candidatus Thiodiazotropha sp. (ex Lucinoma borealis)]